MAVGAKVRAMFGPYEPVISTLWRSMFVDVDAWTRTIARWSPRPSRILEVGCGEGYSTARLAEMFPGVLIEAIDIADNLGRLYDGPPDAAIFRKVSAEKIAAETPCAYDLVVLSDVLHHVPNDQRLSLLDALRKLLSPGGTLALKDWHRSAIMPIHWAAHFSDRWLTGDRVQYLRRDEARALVASVFGPDAVSEEETIRPWKNNYAFRIVSE